MGYAGFVRYQTCVLFENILFWINVNGYKLWLVPKKSAHLTVSHDIGDISGITSDIIFV